MSDPSPQSEVSPAVSTLLVIGGIVFICVWIAAHLIWASMALMGGLMANDAGAASSDQHSGLILGMLAGQVLAGGAGIPGGLAFFWRGKRKLLWGLFALFFVIGGLCQAWAFYSFFASVS
jgi:hypothetical protein